MKEINFFTACNGEYVKFIPMFIFSHLFHNENSYCEIIYEGVIDKKSMEFLYSEFPNRFGVRNKKIGEIIQNEKLFKFWPHSHRFLETPDIKSTYVYISDIDIICLERNVQFLHIEHMKKMNMTYSNIVRKDSKRLSGLHFTLYDSYYPIPDLNEFSTDKESHFEIVKNDENLLYEIVKYKNKINYENNFRPVHGIHASLNRPHKKNIHPHGFHWGIPGWAKEWNIFRNSIIFKEFEKNIDYFTSDIISKIDSYHVEFL